MGRSPCCDKTQVKRGPWSPEEDSTLKNYVETNGTGGNWIALPRKAGLKRCGKSCRLRWLNYLRPDIKHGGFTKEEDDIILNLFHNIGSRWSVIASNLPGRTDNDVKNYWNTKLKKKLKSAHTATLSTSTSAATSTSTSAITTANSDTALARTSSGASLISTTNNYSENNWHENFNPIYYTEVIDSQVVEEDHIEVPVFVENPRNYSNYFGFPGISEEISGQISPSFFEGLNAYSSGSVWSNEAGEDYTFPIDLIWDLD